MYSVFIVDDEHIVLDGIRNKIDWEASGFTFAGEATDGELAFSMIQDVKPDILITDIKMPFMDGLELASLLKKVQPWIRIIILSGHDEFDFAKKAISIGVEDYILKPFTSDELLHSLLKVRNALDKERKQFMDYANLKKELESNSILVKNSFLSDLIHGHIDISSALKKAEELNISIFSRYYKVIVSAINFGDNLNDLVQGARSRLLSLNKSREDVISFFADSNRFVTIVKGNSGTEVEESSFAFSEAIEHILIQSMECTVVSAIGKTVEHISHIKDSYKDCEQLLEKAKFWSKNRIVSSDDITNSSDGFLSLTENDPLVDRLRYANSSEIQSIIDQYMELLADNSSHFSVIASYLFVDVIMAISKLVEDLGGDIKQVMPEILTHNYVDKAVQSQSTFISEVSKVLNGILAYRDSRITGKYGDVILKAKEFISKNYASQDTCLKIVADAVHLSPNHFSTVFSQECGITFIEYLTNVRIEEAKKLLRESDMRSSDIAYECGFSDPHYFSFIFKKNLGMSPREYKNSVKI